MITQRIWISIVWLSTGFASAAETPIESFYDPSLWSNSSQMVESIISDRIPKWHQSSVDDRNDGLQSVIHELRQSEREQKLDPYLSRWTQSILQAIQSGQEPGVGDFIGIDPILYLEKKSKLSSARSEKKAEFFQPGKFLSRKGGWWKRYSRRVSGLGKLSLPSFVLSQYLPLQQRELTQLFTEFKDVYTSPSGSIEIKSGEKSYSYPLSLRERGRVACRVLLQHLAEVTKRRDSYLYSRTPGSGDALAAAWLDGSISDEEALFYSRTPCLDELKTRNADRLDRIETWVSPLLLLTPTLNLFYMSVSQVRHIIQLFRQSKQEVGDERLLVR